MDETGVTSINVTNTANPINIPAGEFRIFGNRPTQALSNSDFNLTEVQLYPNPTNSSFRINTNVSSVEIFDLTGKLINTFNENLSANTVFDISSLKAGIYMVNIKTDNSLTKTTKLMKQ